MEIELENHIKKRDDLYSIIGQEGFERWWINTIIDFEEEQLKDVIKTEREAARKKYFGDANFKDIDIFDKRIELTAQEIEQARSLYIQGNKTNRT